MKLDTGHKIAIASGLVILVVISVVVIGFVVNLKTTHDEVSKIYNHAKSLTDAQWEQVLDDCRTVHAKYEGKSREFPDVPFETLPESIQAFGFTHKLRSETELFFLYPGRFITNTAEFRYTQNDANEWVIEINRVQVFPRKK